MSWSPPTSSPTRRSERALAGRPAGLSAVRVTLVAVGRRMPRWIASGVEEYARRLPAHWSFSVREVREASGGNALSRTAREGELLLGAAAGGASRRAALPHLVALDERGRSHATADLAVRLGAWQELGRDVALLVGGADGLHADVLARADERWSLSPLTFPHPLVRVIVVEQLYRAWTLCTGHPYHRA